MLNLILILVPVVIGFLLSELSNICKRKFEFKEQLLLTNYTLRMNAYGRLHKALNQYGNYFTIFLNPGNEFMDSRSTDQFAPLQPFKDFSKDIEFEMLWLEPEVRELVDNLFTESNMACNLAVYSLSDYSIKTEEAIKNTCRSIEKQINHINDKLATLTRMSDLDRRAT